MINNNDGTFSFLVNNTNLAITAAQCKEGYVNGRRIIVSNFKNGNNQKFLISKNGFATISSSEQKNFFFDLNGGQVYNKSIIHFWQHYKDNDNISCYLDSLSRENICRAKGYVYRRVLGK